MVAVCLLAVLKRKTNKPTKTHSPMNFVSAKTFYLLLKKQYR